MTEAEQEALSHKYVAPHVLFLSTGEFAFFGADRRLLHIGPWEHMEQYVRSYVMPRPQYQPKRTAPVRSTLTLEDLDL